MDDAAAPLPAPALDGRRARRESNRERVVDALLELFRQGHVVPSLDLVAERSGVSHRSVFRYFDDLEELHRVAIERSYTRHAHLFDLPGIGEGSLAARIERLVDHRLALHDETANLARVARMKAPTHPVLAQNIAANRSLLREQLVAHFGPELERAGSAVLVTASTLTAMEAIDVMMTDNDRGAVRAGLVESLGRLLTEKEAR